MENFPGESQETGKMPPAETGNASNPSPNNEENETPREPKLLNKEAEKYLREVSSIEDAPDAQDEEDMDEALKRNNK
jgi:hypothetical protein